MELKQKTMHVSGKLSPVHKGQLKIYFSIQQAEQLAKASTETFKSTTCPLQVCCWASTREGMLPNNLYSLQASPPFHICHMCPLWSPKGSTLSSFRRFVFLVVFSAWVNVQRRVFGRSSDKPGWSWWVSWCISRLLEVHGRLCVLSSFWRPTWASGHFLNSAVFFRRSSLRLGSGLMVLGQETGNVWCHWWLLVASTSFPAVKIITWDPGHHPRALERWERMSAVGGVKVSQWWALLCFSLRLSACL